MIGFGLTAGVALAGLVVAPLLLRGSALLDPRPRVGLAIWFAGGLLGWLSVLSLALRVALGSPRRTMVSSLGSFIQGFADGHPLRGFGLKEVIGLSVTFDVLALLIGSWTISAWSIYRHRRAQRTLLDLLGTINEHDPSLRLLDAESPVAYFLPGHGGRIVISEGTRRILSLDELDAVIAHEHGHRRGHHGSLLVQMGALTPFVSFLPYARYASQAVSGYLEMAADDCARRRVPLDALRRALEKAAVLDPSPVHAIGWNAANVRRRIARLDQRLTPVFDAWVLAVIVMFTAPTLFTIFTLR